jgi:thiosulfate/3-mercaptopyruvate sulfurtransferase
MSYAVEQNEKFAAYADPERLVSTEWLAAALEAGALADGKLVVVESDEDVLLYETGHIPGSVKIDWHTDLNDEVTRDYVNGEAFAALAAAKGISRDATVVIYGDKSNSGSLPCSATKMSGCSTAAGTSGSPKAAN